jgi:hypothetical protein
MFAHLATTAPPLLTVEISGLALAGSGWGSTAVAQARQVVSALNVFRGPSCEDLGMCTVLESSCDVL